MITIEEEVMDSYLDNVWPFVKSLAGVALAGWFLGFATDLNSTAFAGASTVFAMLAYIPFVMYKYMRAVADDKRFDVEVAEGLRAKALEQAQQAIAQRNQVATLAGEWKNMATAMQDKANAIATEVERLRKSEQSLLTKVQALNSQLADADKGLASADELLALAKANEQKAVASAIANATKPLAPYVELAKLYAQDRALMSVINDKSRSIDEHSKAREGRADIKSERERLINVVQQSEGL